MTYSPNMTPEQHERILEQKRQYNAEHRDAINQKHREYYRKYRATINSVRRWRYANDSEYRERILAAQYRRNHDPGYKERKNAKLRERYATDEAYREKRKEKAREYHRTHPRGGRDQPSQSETI